MICKRARRVLVLGEAPAAEALHKVWRAASPRRARRWQLLGTVATSENWAARAEHERADMLALALESAPDAALLAQLARARERGMTIVPLHTLYAELTGRLPLAYHAPNEWPLLLMLPPSVPWYAAFKRTMDILVALFGLAIFALVLPPLALLIVLDSHGPVFFRQERVGQGGRIFRIVKLRTMIPDAERLTGPQWAQRNDPRVTRVGRWLRRARLDEVPQLFNVLRGEMSLVGPRPERPAFVEELSHTLPAYPLRHTVKPGITGWAQVQYRYGNSSTDARVKLEYDLYYLVHRSLSLDAQILLRTVGQVLWLRGV